MLTFFATAALTLSVTPPDRFEMLAARRLEVLQGVEACVVVAGDSSMRRVDLVTGETTAVALEHVGEDSWWIWMRSLEGNQLATWSSGGTLYLRDASTLVPLHVIQLLDLQRVAAVASDGERVVLRRDDGPLELRSFDSSDEHVLLPSSTDWGAAAFSPDSSKLAFVDEKLIHVRRASDGTPVTEIVVKRIPSPTDLAFYGEDHVLAGWNVYDGKSGNDGPMGADLLRISDGELIARLIPSAQLCSGDARDLRGDPDLGLISFTIGNAGCVAAFGLEGETWKERWMIDYGMGNPNGLWLRRTRGSDRIYLSGMNAEFARVLDLDTGENLAPEASMGFFLAGTSSDRFAVSEYESNLLILDGETFELLYTRTEGRRGMARILRDGTETDLQAPEPAATESAGTKEPR